LRGWAGKWNRRAHGHWPFIGFIPATLREILKEAAYDADAIISTWRDRGWLLVDDSDKRQMHHQVQIGTTTTRVIAITAQAFRQAGLGLGHIPDRIRQLRNTTGLLLCLMQQPPFAGEPEVRAHAVQTLQAWLATLLAG
jgi:hypothetical protein